MSAIKYLIFLFLAVVGLAQACAPPLCFIPEMPAVQDFNLDAKQPGFNGDAIVPRGSADENNQPVNAFGLDRLMRMELRITGSPLIAGNEVTIFRDGPQAFQAIFSALRQAQHHIHLETYIIDDERIGRRLADILIERSRAGVEVRMVYDAVGGLGVDEAYFDGLRLNGGLIHKYHPINPIEDIRIWRINNRHHRKMIIIDGRVAFIGGMNISDAYYDSPLSQNTGLKQGWRDTQVRVEGPAVHQIQALFVRFWSHLEGTAALEGPAYFPVLQEKGDHLVRTVVSTGGDFEANIYHLYLAAIRNAKKQIWITQGYFSPDGRILKALQQAAAQDVDVRLLLPGLTSSWVTLQASRRHYHDLLSSGVRIFERRQVLQHAKTAVVDGVWSTVGSANLDSRSFLHANEANLVIWSKSFGVEMETLSLDDQGRSEEILLSQWRSRPFRKKLLEFIASWFDYWL